MNEAEIFTKAMCDGCGTYWLGKYSGKNYCHKCVELMRERDTENAVNQELLKKHKEDYHWEDC